MAEPKRVTYDYAPPTVEVAAGRLLDSLSGPNRKRVRKVAAMRDGKPRGTGPLHDPDDRGSTYAVTVPRYLLADLQRALDAAADR